MPQGGLSEVHTRGMRWEVDRTGLHRRREIERSYEDRGDALRGRDIQYVLHGLLFVVGDPAPGAEARRIQEPLCVVDPESMACA